MTHIVPVALLVTYIIKGNHLERLALLIAWADVDAVSTSETVEVVDLDAELETSLLEALARSLE